MKIKNVFFGMVLLISMGAIAMESGINHDAVKKDLDKWLSELEKMSQQQGDYARALVDANDLISKRADMLLSATLYLKGIHKYLYSKDCEAIFDTNELVDIQVRTQIEGGRIANRNQQFDETEGEGFQENAKYYINQVLKTHDLKNNDDINGMKEKTREVLQGMDDSEGSPEKMNLWIGIANLSCGSWEENFKNMNERLCNLKKPLMDANTLLNTRYALLKLAASYFADIHDEVYGKDKAVPANLMRLAKEGRITRALKAKDSTEVNTPSSDNTIVNNESEQNVDDVWARALDIAALKKLIEQMKPSEKISGQDQPVSDRT